MPKPEHDDEILKWSINIYDTSISTTSTLHLQSLSLDISTFHMIGTNQKQGTLFQSTQIASKDADLEVG